MDRNNMRSSYVNSGPRSLPHMSGKRHNGNGHNGNHSGHHGGNHGNHGNHSGNHGNHSGHSGHNGARLSPPAQGAPNQHTPNGQHDDIINYIYDSWNRVTRELERGSDDAKYYQEVVTPRHLANFRPFNLDEWWGRRLIQTINRNKHRS